MEKATDAFRTISETAEDLDLPQHVLRFWETKFSQIRPMKRGGGRRYYRPDDINLLRGIQYLLYGEGYTIKGVQRILREQGVHFVMDVWQHPGEPLPNGGNGDLSDDAADLGDDADGAGELPFDTPLATPLATGAAYDEDPRPAVSPPSAPSPAQRAPEIEIEPEEGPLPAGILPEEREPRGGFRFMERFRGGAEAPPTASGLSRDDVRRLQATLFELLECKRLLDQTR